MSILIDLDFLYQIRKYELIHRKTYSSGQRILDFGAGTGVQAKYLSDLGFDVVAVDLATVSSCHQNTVYDVSLYDGNSLPFDDNAFCCYILECFRAY